MKDTLLAMEDPSLQEVLGLWSPPDSGSETPYSPPEDENCKQISSGLNGSLSQDSSPEMIPGNDKQHPYVPYGHPYKSHHIPLPPDVNQMHHLHHQPPPHVGHPMHAIPQVHQGDVIMGHMNPALINGHGVINTQIPPGQLPPNGVQHVMAQHLPPQYIHPPPQPVPPVEEYRQLGCPSNPNDENSIPPSQSTSNQKKRKVSELTPKSNPGEAVPVVHIKKDPGETSGRGSPDGQMMSQCEEDFGFGYGSTAGDGPPSVYGLGPEYQCIRFQQFLPQTWHVLLDETYKEVQFNYRVDADKGFNFSNADEAFVCQKKNHFQVTVHVLLYGQPKYVKTPEGIKKIDAFFVHFYGCKTESPSQTIKVEQSQSDRSKKAFHPQPIDLRPEQPAKMTVGRLHFSETTSNNMRKKGKPNPDQRYFHLVVSLAAHVAGQSFYIVSHASERIIVRASNPGQFENDIEQSWQKGASPESIYHAGRVGINTDRPDEPLVVHGNVKVTGHIIQPSDKRAKTEIEEMDTREQLRNVASMRIVKYNFKSEFAESVGLGSDNLKGTGVLAQEVQKIIPDAVKPAGDMVLSNGEKIENFLVVNNDRIFMENVGAVKELCKVTDNLETRIDELERMNNKLRKINRFDSIKSVVSGSSVASTSTVTCNSSYAGRRHHDHRRCARGVCVHNQSSAKCRCRNHSIGSDKQELCTNRFMQSIIIILILIMAFCLVSMATLYILDYHKRHNHLPPVTHTTGQSYFVLSPINHSPAPSSIISPTQVTDTQPSHHNAIYTLTNDKHPTRDKAGVTPSLERIPQKDNSSTPSMRLSTTRRPSLLFNRTEASIVHRLNPNSVSDASVNPFNDLTDNVKGTHKEQSEDLREAVPEKSISNGVSNTLSNADKEISV